MKCVNDGIEALRTDELARIEALRTFIFKNDDKFKDSRFTWLYHKTFCYDSVLEEDFLTFIESKKMILIRYFLNGLLCEMKDLMNLKFMIIVKMK